MNYNKITKLSCIAVEFSLLCLILPGYIIFNNYGRFMLYFLWLAALYSGLVLLFRKGKNIADDIWRWKAVNRKAMRPILLRWVIACIGMTVFLYFYEPARLFALPRENPHFIVVIFTAYPLLSALPQELVFCSFFFNRYEVLFRKQWILIIVSAVVFAYAHVLYINFLAPTLSLIAGLIFAHTYSKTRSLALVTVEHSLYGNAMFFIGLGWYFWSGNPTLQE